MKVRMLLLLLFLLRFCCCRRWADVVVGGVVVVARYGHVLNILDGGRDSKSTRPLHTRR